mgnify:CR=1 FL=1
MWKFIDKYLLWVIAAGFFLSVISVFVFHNLTNRADPLGGYPWALGGVTWSDILFQIVPYIFLILIYILTKNTFPKALLFLSSVICVFISIINFSVNDPQHGAERLLVFWGIQVLVVLIALVTNTIYWFASLLGKIKLRA